MLPFDLTSIALFVGMMMSIIAGEAAIHGDTMTLNMNVAPKVTQGGFETGMAEKIFVAESARLVHGPSLIPTPTIRAGSQPTLIGALASPLHLERVVGALQDQFGYDRLVVSAAIVTTADDALRLLIVVEQPSQVAEQIELTQANGDPAELVRRGAAVTMERVSPYRVAQAHYTKGLMGYPLALKDASLTTSRALARPWEPTRASERAMLLNLQAMLSLVDGNIAAADQTLGRVDPIPGVLPQALAVVAFNRAFLAVANKQPAEARTYFDLGQKLGTGIAVPDFAARIMMLEALVAWSDGNLTETARLLKASIAALPTDEKPHAYLARLLGPKVDQTGAEAERDVAVAAKPFVVDVPFLAQSLFLVDPVLGGIRRY